MTKQSQGLDIHNYFALESSPLPHINEHHPLHAKDKPGKSSRVESYYFV